MPKSVLQSLLDDFVLWGSRLADQDDVAAHVRLFQAKQLSPVAAVPAGELDRIDDIAIDTSYGALVASRCYFTGPVSPYSIQGTPGVTLDVGRMLLTVPVIVGDAVMGALSLAARKSYVGEEELGLAQLLGGLIAYAHIHIDGRQNGGTPASVALGNALSALRQELHLTQDELATRIGTSRIAVSRWEGGAQPPSHGPLLRWCAALGVMAEARRPIIRTANITPQLLAFLREDPDKLRELTPEQFEELVAERLDSAGYDVVLTGAVNQKDGGVDIVAVPRQPGLCPYVMAVQAKHHQDLRKTGDFDVRSMFALRDLGFSFGMIVTNTEFTGDALWREEQSRPDPFLRLRDINDLVRWLYDDFTAEREPPEIPPEIEIAKGHVIQVPKPRLVRSQDIWPVRRG